MLPRPHWIGATVAALLILVMGCDFNPTSPFPGFDERGSRVSGRVVSEADAASNLGAHGQRSLQDVAVHLESDPSLQTFVQNDGDFELVGIPDGTVTLVFSRNGNVLGEIRLDGVRPNQEIRIVVEITVNARIVLVSEERDRVEFALSCARSPSFWCKAAQGHSSTLSREELDELLSEAASLLSGVPGLETPEAIAGAVCDRNGDRARFSRELASLALNLAAGLDEGAPLTEEEFATVDEAFEHAVQLARRNPTSDELEDLKEVLDDINENDSTSIPGCDDDDSSDDSKSEDSKSEDSKSDDSSASTSSGS